MHDLDWLFAVGVLFFLLSAWGIGANDVANSYATSVSSKSLTLVQAGCVSCDHRWRRFSSEAIANSV
jgi:phosphate/sulfate permease